MLRLKPLPNLEDESAMAERGRRSALWGAVREAREALRDATSRVQSRDDWPELVEYAKDAITAATRIIELSAIAKGARDDD